MDKYLYHPTYQCPPKAARNVVKQISKLSSLAKTLDEALTELMKEGNDEDSSNKEVAVSVGVASSVIDGDNSEESSSTGTGDVANNECEDQRLKPKASNANMEQNQEDVFEFDDDFRKHLLQKFGETQSDIIWQPESSLVTAPIRERGSESDSDNENLPTATSNKDANKSESNEAKRLKIQEPPSALLQGKLEYYNRFNGQWRIVVSNAVLRPRVNIDYRRRNNKRNCTSLWEQSEETIGEQNRGYIDKSNKLQQEFPTDDDGGIPLAGNVVILAYDDV